ncbi:hypothetical protein HK097_000337 [Rhizophlyctis rosea]|uniref:Condensation domain-containing protein n=1 Tax=Rhizophlyctis rosea TaxID=64517 RepID=A0AAD5X8E0_9FUNG|nr:hypothetical protein HK097_000337 [Rhizophlyctis rosea]
MCRKDNTAILPNFRLGIAPPGAPTSQRPSLGAREPLGASSTPDAESEIDANEKLFDDEDIDRVNSMDPDDEDETQSESKYPPTPFQLDVYRKYHPTQDELESSSMSLYSGPPLFTSQAWFLNSNIHLPDFCASVNQICCSYPVLTTKFYCNEKIVDADVEGLMETARWQELSQMRYVESIDPDEHSALSLMNTAALTTFVNEWLRERDKLDCAFKLLLIRQSSATATRLVTIASNAIADELSMIFVTKEILDLYLECERVRRAGGLDAAIKDVVGSYRRKENYTFANHAYNLSPNRLAIEYWKKQCVETVQDVVNENEKADLEKQLGRLHMEREYLRTQVASHSKRKPELEHDLQVLKQQRKDADDEGSGELSTFLDASGEIIRISEQSQKALVKMVLGEDATTNSTGYLLDKHEVPRDVQEKLGAANMSLEMFASIPEATIADAGLFTKDRRKILALSEFVRNRMKEGLQERAKVKFNLERRIAKIGRELDSCTDNLKAFQDKLESNDDMCIRLANVLNPPYVETKIPPLMLDSSPEGKSSTQSDYFSLWAFSPITITPEIFANLRRFTEGYQTTLRQRRAHLRGKTGPLLPGYDSDTFVSSMDESSGTDSSDASITLRSRHSRLTSTASVCLAAFAVLLKHISGSQKFLLGLRQSYRHNGLLVGPLSDTVPLKVEFRRGTTFNSLFGMLEKGMKEARRFGAVCPLSTIRGVLDARWDLPIQFEFISFRDAETWKSKGLTVNDIIHASEGGTGSATQRVWSMNEADGCDLKLVLVEGQESISGGIKYRKDRFDEENIVKWCSKYSATVESIDFNRKIPVTTMISRYGDSVNAFCQ